MILNRIDSIGVFGVYISANMDVFTFLDALNIGLSNRPELESVFYVLMAPLELLSTVNAEIQEKTTVLAGLKNDLNTAKRVLELATKSYSISATLSIGSMDIKICYNGSPLGTGASAILIPAKVAVESATESLQLIEDQIRALQNSIFSLMNSYKYQLDAAIKAIMDKIAEIGNINITVTI